MPALLAIPPFPGARLPAFAVPGEARAEARAEAGSDDAPRLLAALAEHRVGGCYWGRQVAGPAQLDATNWPLDADPWCLLATAEAVALPADDGRCVLALAANKPLTLVGASDGQACDASALVHAHLTRWQWRDPFNGAAITPLEAIELCGFWRRLIDSNRPLVAALGFAHWKKPTVAPLLWNGRETPFRRSLPQLAPQDVVALWRSRVAPADNAKLSGQPVLEVEDGFIRSAGLGADCVPPLSVIVDERGVHFDPTRPSDLEDLLEHGTFAPALLERAAALRAAILAAGISKYEQGTAEVLPRPGGARRHVLVPGQVEDDRAVTSGGALSSNLELLRRARASAGPDAFVVYKPHPDVLAGHRRGAIAAGEAQKWANAIETEASMAGLIEMVDELHVNSSLAGFEALLRGKQVTVHGVPFYAGWGLTTDLGEVPARRTARRSIDELVAAALLLYPRYLDPETGLPCPAEVLVERLTGQQVRLAPNARAFVAIRRLAGRTNRLLGRGG
jgi:capsular polysaccharide export protein